MLVYFYELIYWEYEEDTDKVLDAKKSYAIWQEGFYNFYEGKLSDLIEKFVNNLLKFSIFIAELYCAKNN